MTRYSALLALASFILLSSCANAPDESTMADGSNMDELAMAVAQRTGGVYVPQDMQQGMQQHMPQDNMPGGVPTNMQQPTGSGKVVMHPIMDSKTGMLASQMPLPDTWRITNSKNPEDPAIVGPSGIKIFYRKGGSHFYSNDRMMQESYRMAGQPMRPPVPIEQLLQQEIAPNLQRQGMQFVRNYQLPEVARRSQQYGSKMYKATASNDSFNAMGSEWNDKEGKPVMMIVNLFVSQGQQDVFWYYHLQVLTAEKPAFEEAKKAFIYGLANTQDNPQQIAANNAAAQQSWAQHNANEQQKANQSWAQHNARMQQNQAAFDQQQATHRSTVDAVNNSMMSTYNSQNASGDHMQRDFINTMRGEETVNNPADGQQYQVESGANQYWMNNNNEYIPSNNTMFDPNADPNLWNQQWQEVTPE
ncbi:MAG: hypothetical protein IPH05_08130 [Flavobacteriales bacterium]|jgi:hypothetical protein|nr:hypothetical protein [Flavobacteriales bacterium]MBK6550545.1 hypothetical protein [Flavobacteriales bacterium]MBK6882898.1 hypothetical protein [Flavobacteriales bacterium]MBK7114235.1 hypothetical protein [Flavobacteriales bacterium]MBK7483711.1 hypothetical protein [Flavobacteriales bacterium]